MTSCTVLIRVAAAALAAATFETVAAQQEFPNKPIRWVTPYPPGGSTTALSRLIGELLTEAFSNAINAIAHIRADWLKGLAVSGEKRTPALPDLPTYAEAGSPRSAFAHATVRHIPVDSYMQPALSSLGRQWRRCPEPSDCLCIHKEKS